MPKDPQLGEKEICIAPGITGQRDERGNVVITDRSNDEPLHPEAKMEHKIRIFERQVNGWFLERAASLCGEEKNGFVVLMIATAYIEGVEQYRQGRESKWASEEFFTCGVKRIFGISDNVDSRLCHLYKELRCGLFHNGMTGPSIRIHYDYAEPIDLSEENIIKINQKLFLKKVQRDFEQYLKGLRDGRRKKLRDNFSRIYVGGIGRT